MKTIKMACLFFSFFLLTSCMVTPFYPKYQIVGNENGKREFRGTMDNDYFDGKMIMRLNSVDGKTRCYGPMIQTRIANASFTCEDTEGTAMLDCTSYNSLFFEVISARYHAEGCDKGVGYGYNESGDIFYFVYHK